MQNNQDNEFTTPNRGEDKLPDSDEPLWKCLQDKHNLTPNQINKHQPFYFQDEADRVFQFMRLRIDAALKENARLTESNLQLALRAGQEQAFKIIAESALALRDKEIARLTDLVRHQRHELLDEKLISVEEFTALVMDSENGARVARLESYDAIRAELARMKGESR